MTQQVSEMDFAVKLIALNGGKIVGKTRFQKTVFLIQKMLHRNIFDFDYHHYGPFSEGLAEAIDLAVARKRVRQESKVGFYEMPYVVFSTNEEPPSKVLGADALRVKKWLAVIERADAISLELAATRFYLQSEFGMTGENLDRQLRQLKPQKATPDKLRESKSLLAALSA